MGYTREIYDESVRTLEQRRNKAQQKADALREKIFKTYPRAAELEAEIADASFQLSRAVLAGGDVTAAVEKIKARNLALQGELAALLHNAGEKSVSFTPKFICPLCDDTGYANGKMCVCLENLLKENSLKRVNKLGSAAPPRFEELQLAYYPEANRPHMRGILEYCRGYAEDFSGDSGNLLLRGPVGVGKTAFSMAIARAVTERGFHVVYGPVQQLLHQLENEHFGRAEGDSEELMSGCDLLILDDLGSEFTGPFYTTALYNLLNTRIITGSPTVISTNLSPKQLTERYGEQIASRITGLFQPLVFEGKDIRQIKLKERIGG